MNQDAEIGSNHVSRVTGLSNVAEKLVRERSMLSPEDMRFWGPTVQAFLAGAMLHVSRGRKNAKESHVAAFLLDAEKTRYEVIDVMLEAKTTPEEQFTALVARHVKQLSVSHQDIVWTAVVNVFITLRIKLADSSVVAGVNV